MMASPGRDAAFYASIRSATKAANTPRQMAKVELSSHMIRGATSFTTCRDPTEDKFLALAVDGRADLILTDAADLLVLNPFRGIPVVAPVTSVTGASR
jgi:predicted nucleic acid-binding protein